MSKNKSRLPGRFAASYTFYCLANQSMWGLINYFLLFFYTDVLVIPPAAATVIFTIARVWDAINDPMMGVICDTTKSREGKSRFWLKRMAIPGGLFLALTFASPNFSTAIKVVWAGVTYICMGMAQTALGIPNNALILTVVPDRADRVRLAQFGAVPIALVNAFIPAVTMPFVRSFGEDNMAKGFFVMAAIISVLYAVSTLLIYKSTEGMDPDTSDSVDTQTSEKKEKVGALTMIKEGLTNKYGLLVILASFCYLLLSGIMGGTLIYYFRYYVGNDGMMGIYSSTIVIGMFIGILSMHFFSKKFGNSTTCIIGCMIAVVAFGIRMVTKDQNTAAFAIAMVMTGWGSNFISNMLKQCNMDAAVWGKMCGINNSGVVLSLYTFAQKAGQAVSSVAAAGLLAIFNYTPGEVPSDTVVKLFYVENIIFPIFLAFVITFIMLFVRRMEARLSH